MREKTVGFEEAVQLGEEIVAHIVEHGLDDMRKQMIRDLLRTAPAARGLFIALLTEPECKLVDEPPDWLLDSIAKAGDHIPDLLAKNLVMSTTMRITHQRQDDLENADGSAMVAQRTASLIKALSQEQVRVKLKEMRASLKTKTGVYADFLQRWQYDEEQVQAAVAAIDQVVNAGAS